MSDHAKKLTSDWARCRLKHCDRTGNITLSFSKAVCRGGVDHQSTEPIESLRDFCARQFSPWTMATAGLSNYAKRMARLAARIFVEVPRPTNSKSMKVVKLFSKEPLNAKQELMDYYPKHNETDLFMRRLRFHGLYRDEHLDFKEEMYRLKKLRGKGKPKKGEGKRAMMRKS